MAKRRRLVGNLCALLETCWTLCTVPNRIKVNFRSTVCVAVPSSDEDEQKGPAEDVNVWFEEEAEPINTPVKDDMISKLSTLKDQVKSITDHSVLQAVLEKFGEFEELVENAVATQSIHVRAFELFRAAGRNYFVFSVL